MSRFAPVGLANLHIRVKTPIPDKLRAEFNEYMRRVPYLKSMVGHEPEVLLEKYAQLRLFYGSNCPYSSFAKFMRPYTYIHMLPTYEQCQGIKTIDISPSQVHRDLIPHLLWYGAQPLRNVDMMYRRNLYNHAANIPRCVTLLTDTIPLGVSAPCEPELSNLLYQPKYGKTVFKAQITPCLIGPVCDIGRGLYVGVNSDAMIWRDINLEALLDDWEYVLGDGAYVAEEHVLTPIRALPHEPLDLESIIYNAAFSKVRSRTEHINALVKKHQALCGRFRGNVNILWASLCVTVDTLNIYLKDNLKYDPVGPYEHGPVL